MNNIYFLQKVIDYIHENLKTEIRIDELASISSFSKDYLNHIFKNYVGMPVFTYVTKCRLQAAIYEAFEKDIKIIDVSLGYGFDTHAGFYKAFKRQYGCSPSKYLKINKPIKLNRLNLNEECRVMLTKKDIKRYLELWNIDKDMKIENAYGMGGEFKQDNVFYIGEEYVLKTGKNIPQMRTHVESVKALEEEGMDSGSIIKTSKGEEFVLEDERYFLLSKRIKGNILTLEERYEGNVESTGVEYGEAIGHLQKALNKQDKNLDLKEENMLDTVMRWAMPNTKRIMEQWGCPLPDEFFQELEREFSELAPSLSRGVIHRDANPSNILFFEGKVSGFVDFEISSKNFRIFDPCYCATGILAEAQKNEESYEKWPVMLKGIIKGYDNIMKLSEDEIKAIPYIVYGIQMILIAYLESKDELKQLAIDNRNMLLWIWENRDIIFD